MGNAEYKRKHREQGLCIDCSRIACPGTIRCLEHLYVRAAIQQDYYRRHRQLLCNNSKKDRQQRKKFGLCIKCGNERDEDIDNNLVSCQNCREGLFFERCK